MFLLLPRQHSMGQKYFLGFSGIPLLVLVPLRVLVLPPLRVNHSFNPPLSLALVAVIITPTIRLLLLVVPLRVLPPLPVNSSKPLSSPTTLAIATTPNSITLLLLVLSPLRVLPPSRVHITHIIRRPLLVVNIFFSS
jgi:hypothetical protein